MNDELTNITARSNGCKDGITGKVVKSDKESFVQSLTQQAVDRNNRKPVKRIFKNLSETM